MKCFYHCDMDGRCAGAVVAKYENNYNREDFFEVDYIDPFPIDKIKTDEKVYLVDYSFKKDTVWQLERLREKNCDIIWIDHHTSSLNLQKDSEYAWINDINGIRSDEASGAALVYMYLYNTDFEGIPYAVKLVSDYDCWIYKYDPDTTHFKIGLETIDYDAVDEVWRDLIFLEDEDEFKRTARLYDLQDKGKIIKGYIDMSATSYENGHKVIYINDEWCWEDTLEPIPKQILNEWKDRCSGDGWKNKGNSHEWRPCAKCLEYPNERGDDFCIQNLGKVWNACCGHGNGEGYIQFENGITIRGIFKIEYWDKEKWEASH